MQELEKILEEIKVSSVYAEVADGYGAMCVSIGTIECIIRKHMNDGNDINVAAKDDGWIPVERELPKDDKYFLLSFSNSSLPMVGRYDRDEEGAGHFIWVIAMNRILALPMIYTLMLGSLSQSHTARKGVRKNETD